MIISASRRTDIPAFYAEWFMNRIREGYCTVPNPFNPEQVSRISLCPADVEAIVFWTRNPRPLLPHLAELDARGYAYYFQFTLMNNPAWLDPKAPPPGISLRIFRELSEAIGPERVIWRYDPIVFTSLTDAAFHRQTYERLARALRSYTKRSVVSLVDFYRKTARRMQDLSERGMEMKEPDRPFLEETMPALAATARQNGMELFSCAEETDFSAYGIQPGKCVDDALIRQAFGREVSRRKDPAQRKACGCVVSRDIGMYDSCLFGCVYCYATKSFARAGDHHRDHDPHSPSLIGRQEAASPGDSLPCSRIRADG